MLNIYLLEHLYLVMVNGIRTIYPSRLNKGFGLKFCVDSQDRYETAEEGQKMHWPKLSEYNKKDKDNSPNILSDKNCQASSQKFTQIITWLWWVPSM